MAGNARGIDVSDFAGEFNWSGTSGLSFGICRASQGLGAVECLEILAVGRGQQP